MATRGPQGWNTESANKYKSRNVKRVPLEVSLENYHKYIRYHAETASMTVNTFIKRSIEEKMYRMDNDKDDLAQMTDTELHSGLQEDPAFNEEELQEDMKNREAKYKENLEKRKSKTSPGE